MTVVLVVDDEMGIARLLEDVLVDEGFEVVLASNGLQALERAAEAPPALIVTDYMMPVMDGAALVGALRASPTLKNVPVILMSSVPEETVSLRCIGYTRFVPKPFNIFGMIDAVTELAQPIR